MEPCQTTHQDRNDGTRPSFGSGQSGCTLKRWTVPVSGTVSSPEWPSNSVLGTKSLRNRVRQDEVDRGERRGTTTEDEERIVALEREVRELRRANEILKAASVCFATELDGRRPR